MVRCMLQRKRKVERKKSYINNFPDMVIPEAEDESEHDDVDTL